MRQSQIVLALFLGTIDGAKLLNKPIGAPTIKNVVLSQSRAKKEGSKINALAQTQEPTCYTNTEMQSDGTEIVTTHCDYGEGQTSSFNSKHTLDPNTASSYPILDLTEDNMIPPSNGPIPSSNDITVKSQNDTDTPSNNNVTPTQDMVAVSNEMVALSNDMVAASNEMVEPTDDMVAASDDMIAASDDLIIASNKMAAASPDTIVVLNDSVSPSDDTAAPSNACDWATPSYEWNTPLEEFNMIQLKAHNDYRSYHGTGPMEYDEELARGSQQWAEYMASAGMQHSTGGNYGENLAMNSQKVLISTTANATDMWYNELHNPGYNFNNPGYSSGIGHFTQVVWKGSTKLGCGVSGMYVCCRYSQAGNMNMPGYFEKNVLPLGSECSSEPEPSPNNPFGNDPLLDAQNNPWGNDPWVDEGGFFDQPSSPVCPTTGEPLDGSGGGGNPWANDPWIQQSNDPWGNDPWASNDPWGNDPWA